jgi:hypothetical protein
MAKMPPLQKALRKALREQPCSVRRLSIDSGVPYSNLMEAKEGTRPVSAGMVEKVVRALHRWANECNALADELQAAMEGGSDE